MARNAGLANLITDSKFQIPDERKIVRSPRSEKQSQASVVRTCPLGPRFFFTSRGVRLHAFETPSWKKPLYT